MGQSAAGVFTELPVARPMPLLRRSAPVSTETAEPPPAATISKLTIKTGRGTVARSAVRAAREPAPVEIRPRGRCILRGDLENIGLPTLLTIVDMERRSGVLVIERHRLMGRLHVREGRVVRARVEGTRRFAAAEQAGAEAVYDMLTWDAGQFELWLAPVEEEDEVGQSTTFLLLESARRADEAAGQIAGASVAAVSADGL